jgi:hypothetical protein
MKINDVVFTNHAIERMKERGISGDLAWQSVRRPDRTTPGKEKHTTEFIKYHNKHTITTIAKKNDLGEWVVLSAWIDPPLSGTADYWKKEKYHKKIDKLRELDKKMEKASFWGKLWLTFRKQTGI